jgi:hypothetical protein
MPSDVAGLAAYLSCLSAAKFTSISSSFSQTITQPLNLTGLQDISYYDYSNYRNSLKELTNNAYILDKHIYRLRVIIRPANWMEALNYHAFSLTEYFVVFLLLLLILTAVYFVYHLLHLLPISAFLFTFYKDFTESKIEGKKFYEKYRRSNKNFGALLSLVLNSVTAFFIITIPIGIVMNVVIPIFALTKLFDTLPSNYMQKSSDFNNTDDPAVQKMILANILSRIGIGIFLMGFGFLVLGGSAIKPDPLNEMVEKKLITDNFIKEKYNETIAENFTISAVIVICMFIYQQMKTTFILNPIMEVAEILIYQIVISNAMLIFFENIDELTFNVINTVINLLSYSLVMGCQELNLMVLLFFTHQSVKLVRLLLFNKISQFSKLIINKLFKLHSDTDKMLEMMFQNKKTDGKIIDENETKVLNNNLRDVGFISSDISQSLMMITYLSLDLSIRKIVLKSEDSDVINQKCFLIMYGLSFALDIINYYFIINASEIKHRKIILI